MLLEDVGAWKLVDVDDATILRHLQTYFAGK